MRNCELDAYGSG